MSPVFERRKSVFSQNTRPSLTAAFNFMADKNKHGVTSQIQLTPE
jgi:hypothetical protein